MPLSKARNRARMREFRLHVKKDDIDVQPNVPLYDPSIHKSGDIVRVWDGSIVTLLPLDADGYPIPEIPCVD